MYIQCNVSASIVIYPEIWNLFHSEPLGQSKCTLMDRYSCTYKFEVVHSLVDDDKCTKIIKRRSQAFNYCKNVYCMVEMIILVM